MVSTCDQKWIGAALLLFGLLGSSAHAGDAAKDESPAEQIRISERPAHTRKRAEAIGKLAKVTKEQNREFNVDAFLLKFAQNADQSSRLRRIAVQSLIQLIANVDSRSRGRSLDALAGMLRNAKHSVGVRIAIAKDVHLLAKTGELGASVRTIQALEAIAENKTLAAGLRTSALRSLGSMKSTGSFRVILVALRDKTRDVQMAAVDALSLMLTPPPVIKPNELMAVLRHLETVLTDKSMPVQVRSRAMTALARLKYGKAEDLIARIVTGGKAETGLVVAAIHALALFGNPAHLKTLVGAIAKYGKKSQASVRTAACDALGDLLAQLAKKARGPSRDITAITDCLVKVLFDDESADVVAAAAFALGNLADNSALKSTKVLKALIGALDDPDPKVQQYCRKSLELLTNHYPTADKDLKKRWEDWLKANEKRLP